MEDKKIARLTLDLSPELHRRLKQEALDKGTTMRALLVTWAQEKLAAGQKPERGKQ